MDLTCCVHAGLHQRLMAAGQPWLQQRVLPHHIVCLVKRLEICFLDFSVTPALLLLC